MRTLVLLFAALFSITFRVSAQHDHAVEQPVTAGIPSSLVVEHDALHERLVAVIELGGATGDAGREVARRLHAHFEREEEFALPPLGLLEPLARGECLSSMHAVLPLVDTLRAEYDRMVSEHAHIVEALELLRSAATVEGHMEGVRFADALRVHARNEEQVLYPAALLVGERIRACLAAHESR